MTGNGFEMTAGELRAHESKLNAIGDKLKQALDAAHQVSMGDEAYGIICSFFVPIVHAVTDPGLDALSQANTAVVHTASGIRATSQAYSGTEASNTTPFAGGAS